MPIKLKNLKPGDLLVDVVGGSVGFEKGEDGRTIEDTPPNTRYMVKSIEGSWWTMYCFATGLDTTGWRSHVKNGQRYIHPDLRRVKNNG